ncbi:MAG: hypothetical protein OQJ84_05215 [Xanthomonadales bacterium]|nr:hypothetical protein [Xanthomonadales bacterium]
MHALNVKRLATYLVLVFTGIIACNNAVAQKINADSLASIVRALQTQVKEHPSVFPLESFDGGIQSIEQGLRVNYFGYGERRYTHRFDFHPAMDVGYFPTEIGNVTDEQGETWQVRAPQSYLKKVYAIQKGELVSLRLIASGYKLILKHSLENPYYDNDGKAYDHYFTCYRHLDSRSIAYLDGVAREFTGRPDATYTDLVGEYVFEAGEQLAVVGFPPDEKSVEIPRAHLDFSLNMFADPDKGINIRNYALNPLLLFPPFEYANPLEHDISAGQVPAYTFFVKESGVVTPGKDKSGGFHLYIASGGKTADGELARIRYFVLNGLDIVVNNGGKQLAAFVIDRQRKLGYDTKSYDSMDNPNRSVPHMIAPLGEQGDVYKVTVVLPAAWFEDNGYDWSKPGSVEIGISSIWSGYLEGHASSLTIPIPATDK